MSESFKCNSISYDEYLTNINELELDNKSIYLQKEWLECIKNGFNCDLTFLECRKELDEVIALTPFMIKKKGPFSISGSPLRGMYTEFAGCMFKNDYDKKSMQLILKSQHNLLKKSNYYIEYGFKDSHEIFSLVNSALLELGYEYESRPSLLIDLSLGEEKIWKGFQGRARNMIRKANKSEISAKTIIPNSSWINEYYLLLTETFSKRGLSAPHPLKFFIEIIKLYKSNNIKCVEVKKDDKLIAASIFILDQKRMTYFSGVANKEGMQLAATSLIQWHAIKESITSGFTEYDLGGLGIDSIDKFKRSFGGEGITHHRWIYRKKVFKIIEPILIWFSRKGFLNIWT